MSINGSYDVIIIGSDAGGGTLARRLAPHGQAANALRVGEHLEQRL
jgi:choline dehydrogenase-like flavoprotein